jgi:hypothetical protein
MVGSNHAQVWRGDRVLTLVNGGKTPSLGDPGLSVSEAGEALGFLDKFAPAAKDAGAEPGVALVRAPEISRATGEIPSLRLANRRLGISNRTYWILEIPWRVGVIADWYNCTTRVSARRQQRRLR